MLFLCCPLFAQDFPAVEVSGGYSLLRDDDLTKHGSGWVGSVDVNFDRWTGIMVELGGNYSTSTILGKNVDAHIYSYMAGPQFSIRNRSRAVPFVQILIGGTTRNITHIGGTDNTDLAMQLGGGVDWWLRPKVGLRFGSHYRHTFANALPSDGFRLQAGMVFGLGRRQ